MHTRLFHRSLRLDTFFGLLVSTLLIISCVQSRSIPEVSPTSFKGFSTQDINKYKRAASPIPLIFPDDHGAHPDFLTEWWYYTGNLDTADSRHFGYQLTFFRRALAPPAERIIRSSNWATDQIYMAHFAITDVSANEFYYSERFSRGTAGLAGTSSPPFQVWLYDWKVEQIAENDYRLYAADQSVMLDLVLHDLKGPILNGIQGYSQKGPQLGNASIYISQTRLETKGTILIDKENFIVEGLSWMDHEFSTSALTEDQVGWDWFALQLDNGSELMVFNLRNQDGSVDPFSSGTYIDPDGATTNISRDEFRIEILDYWLSSHSKAEYPSRWRILIPSLEIDLEVKPHIPDQELNLTFTYWEGAVGILGEQNGNTIQGNGYVELTGYSGAFAGDF